MSATAAERAELREMAGQLARCQLAPHAAQLDAGDQATFAECWSLAVDTGLDRALLDERHGGAGLAVPDLLVTVEELAVGDGGVAMCVLLCNAALGALGEEQLEEVCEGERWALVPVGPETELLRPGDARLDGEIACALGAWGADGLVLLCDGSHPSTWLLAPGSAGLRVEREVAQMGLRAAQAATVALQRVGATRGLAPGSGADGRFEAAPGLDGVALRSLLRAGTAAIARGIARRAYELALDYAHERHQGGVAIVEHDAVSDMLSAMTVRLQCWPSLSGGAPSEVQALAMKISATDAAMASATDAVQVFGGTGYMLDTGVEKLMRDAKYCQLFPESNWVAQRELMRLPHPHADR